MARVNHENPQSAVRNRTPSRNNMKPDSGSRITPPAVYYFRRELDRRETLTAAGIAVGAGLAAFYLARIMLQRTPIAREEGIPEIDERGVIVRRARRDGPEARARR
jgi:hypothetical protein